jgi:hypothetical protein
VAAVCLATLVALSVTYAIGVEKFDNREADSFRRSSRLQPFDRNRGKFLFSIVIATECEFRGLFPAGGCIDATQFLNPLSHSGFFHRRAEGDFLRAGGRCNRPLCWRCARPYSFYFTHGLVRIAGTEAFVWPRVSAMRNHKAAAMIIFETVASEASRIWDTSR